MSNQIDRVFVNGKWYVSDSARQFAQAQAVREAIAAERAKWSAFADEKGEPKKVLGTLPMTADGAYVGDDGNCFFPWRYGNRVVMMKKVRHCGLVCQEGDCVASIEECYSTREAAEAARGGGQ